MVATESAGAGGITVNGKTWFTRNPPLGVAPPTPQPIQPSVLTEGNSPPPRAKDFNEFRSQLMTVDEFKRVSKGVPLSKRPQKWWDLLSILGGIAAAVIWSLYAVIRSGQEGFDFITPLLMIAIPVILVWFRADIDEQLIPFQKYRKNLSRNVLIGLGLVVPFLTGWILYNILQFSNYPLMWANIIVGPLVSYAIVREPILAQGIAREGRRVSPPTFSIIFFVLLISLIVVPVMADHCLSDPLNAQDCLRSSGYAEILAGTFGTVLGALVNGPIIIQGIAQASAVAGAVPLPSDNAVVDLKKLGKKEITPDRAAGSPIWDKSDEAKARWRDYREHWERQRDISLEEARRFNEDVEKYEMLKNIADWVKFGCDKTIDVLKQYTGTPGKVIAMGYTMATNIGEGVGQAWVDPDNWSLYLARGGTKGLIDLEADVAWDLLPLNKGFLKDLPVKEVKNVTDMTIREVSKGVYNTAKGCITGDLKEIAVDGIHKDDLIGINYWLKKKLTGEGELTGIKDYVDKLGRPWI